MSDVMLYGVLRMPYEMAMSSELSRYQFYQRAQEAADRLEAVEGAKAAPVPASTGRESFAMQLGRESLPFDVAARELDVEVERREFEVEWRMLTKPHIPNFKTDARGDYNDPSLFAAWRMWQASAARSAAQSTEPEPAKPWPQVNAEAIAAGDLLDWNRSQSKRPIEVTKELAVAYKAFEFLAAAKVIAAAQEANRAAPVSTEQAGDAWISVEDARKPVGRTPILVAVSFVRFGEYEDGTPGEWPGQIVAEGEYVRQHGEVGDYFTCYSSPHGDLESITHWMHLPVAPSPNNSPVGGKD